MYESGREMSVFCVCVFIALKIAGLRSANSQFALKSRHRPATRDVCVGVVINMGFILNAPFLKHIKML